MALLLAVIAALGLAESAAAATPRSSPMAAIAADEHECDPAFEHDTYGSVQYCPIWMPSRGYVPVHALGSGRPVEVGRLDAAGKANWFICQMNYEGIGYTAPGTAYRNTWWALTISDDGHKAWVSEVYFRGGENYEPDGGLRVCGTDRPPPGSGAPPSTRPETRPEGDEPQRASGKRRWSWWGGGVKRARFKGVTPTKCFAYFGVKNWGDRLEPHVRGKCSVKGPGSVDLLVAELWLDGGKIGNRKVCYGPLGNKPGDCDEFRKNEIFLKRKLTLSQLWDRNGEMAGKRICFDALVQKDGSYTGMRNLTICGRIPSRPPQRIRPGRQP